MQGQNTQKKSRDETPFSVTAGQFIPPPLRPRNRSPHKKRGPVSRALFSQLEKVRIREISPTEYESSAQGKSYPRP